MQCYQHPGWDAMTRCTSCKEPLCYQCAVRRDGYFLCSWCFALEKISHGAEGNHINKERKEDMLEGRQNIFKRKLLRMLQV